MPTESNSVDRFGNRQITFMDEIGEIHMVCTNQLNACTKFCLCLKLNMHVAVVSNIVIIKNATQATIHAGLVNMEAIEKSINSDNPSIFALRFLLSVGRQNQSEKCNNSGLKYRARFALRARRSTW